MRRARGQGASRFRFAGANLNRGAIGGHRFLVAPFNYNITGTTYYVSSEGDNTDGLSHATAYTSYASAMSNFSSLAAGDAILFAAGESFTSNAAALSNLNSTNTNRILIGAYVHPTTGSTTRPIINGGAYGFNINSGSFAEGFTITDLTIQNATSNGLWCFNNVSNITLENCNIKNCGNGILLQDFGSGAMANVQIKTSNIFDNTNMGFLGGGDNLLIEDCQFYNNGGPSGAALNHNIYVSDASGSTTGVILRRNKAYQSAMNAGTARGSSIVLHGLHANATIDGNIVWEDIGGAAGGAWGLSVMPDYAFAEDMSGMSIINNTVVNVGNLAIGLAAAPNSIIQNNVILHQQTSHGVQAISVPGKSEAGDANTTNVNVSNNEIIHDTSTAMTALNIGEGDGATYTVQNNNIYYSTGSAVPTNSFDPGDSITQSGNTPTTPEPTGRIAEILALCVIT